MKAKPKKVAGPKPRTIPKRPVKRCANGHRQSWNWKGPDCTACFVERLRADEALSVAFDRQAAMEALGPPPETMEIRTGDGKVLRYGVPARARCGAPKRGRRRGLPL